jgi:hypothetical protein
MEVNGLFELERLELTLDKLNHRESMLATLRYAPPPRAQSVTPSVGVAD